MEKIVFLVGNSQIEYFCDQIRTNMKKYKALRRDDIMIRPNPFSREIEILYEPPVTSEMIKEVIRLNFKKSELLFKYSE